MSTRQQRIAALERAAEVARMIGEQANSPSVEALASLVHGIADIVRDEIAAAAAERVRDHAHSEAGPDGDADAA